ncbi:LETM1-like domain protein [Bacteriovorax sp. Seq25_V]|nr:LETM1-like domain protein [Bacteriovorax sp. Seq25_V]
MKRILHEESTESAQMLEIYQRMLKKRATDDEVKWANEQFRDVLRTVGLGALLLLPFAPVTLPFFIKLSKRIGFNILPSSFNNKIKEK